jgi:hypothetical protein
MMIFGIAGGLIGFVSAGTSDLGDNWFWPPLLVYGGIALAVIGVLVFVLTRPRRRARV